MRKLVLSCLATSLTIFCTEAQTLFTYGNTPVTKQEFLRIYQKNSINKKTDYSEPALREYLDLYSLFKMKVREADIMQLDTMQSISAELDNYRHQLARNYLTDKEVTNRLTQEVYDRMKQELHVSHILIGIPAAATPDDTLKAKVRIDSIYAAVTKGKADFAKLANQLSDDVGTRDAGGDIGFITAMQTFYPFENAAYNTPIGKVSAPLRTQFGYHILKVIDKRPARGEVQTAHILISTPKSKGNEGITAARRRADSVVMLYRKGVSFDTLVARYSEDKITLAKNGVMDPFGVGRYQPAFENAAFSLKKPGDITNPVQTDYGFHILRLISHTPLKPFDSVKENIRRRVENDSRAAIAKEEFMSKIKKQHKFKEFPAALSEILQRVALIPDTGATANAFKAEDFKRMNKPMFELSGNSYLQSDFMSFAEGLTRGRLNGPKTTMINDIYNLYIDRTINDFEEHHLADNNADFRNLMEEYRNGIMIFELMDRNVWGKASRDTVGLKEFYSQNKTKYQWEPGFTGAVYRFKDETALKQGVALLNKKGTTDEDLAKALNTESAPDAIVVQRGHYEFSRFKEAPQSSVVKGKTGAPVRNADGSYTVVKADEIFTGPTQKSLDEARGYAVAEYQDSLEKKWNASLRAKYPVKVEEDVFRSMIK